MDKLGSRVLYIFAALGGIAFAVMIGSWLYFREKLQAKGGGYLTSHYSGIMREQSRQSSGTNTGVSGTGRKSIKGRAKA